MDTQTDFLSFTQDNCRHSLMQDCTPDEIHAITTQEDESLVELDGGKVVFYYCMN